MKFEFIFLIQPKYKMSWVGPCTMTNLATLSTCGGKNSNLKVKIASLILIFFFSISQVVR